MSSIYLLNIITDYVSNSFGMQNALAFDADDLSTVNTAFLLANLTKSVIVEGFEFTTALEHCLKENSTLRKHSAVIHLAPDKVTRYVWTHNTVGILRCWLEFYVHFIKKIS